MRRLRFADESSRASEARTGRLHQSRKASASVLLAELAGYPVCGSLWLEVLDTNAGKGCRPRHKFDHCAHAGEGQALAGGTRRFRTCCLQRSAGKSSSASASTAQQRALADRHPTPEVSPQAPSRSTLKLEGSLAPVHPARQMG